MNDHMRTPKFIKKKKKTKNYVTESRIEPNSSEWFFFSFFCEGEGGQGREGVLIIPTLNISQILQQMEQLSKREQTNSVAVQTYLVHWSRHCWGESGVWSCHFRSELHGLQGSKGPSWSSSLTTCIGRVHGNSPGWISFHNA